MLRQNDFELRATDLGGRIGTLKTKTSQFETPALLPVVHPVRQLVLCKEIKEMGYEAVMTNAYTTFRRLAERASEGIHKIIDYDGTIMTDSGGYQVLEFGSVEISPVEMALFEEKIGSDIAIVLDKPTGLKVTRKHASETVKLTLEAAKTTREVIKREDMIWTLPIQGGRYSELVSKSAKASAKLDYGCYALGSPVEVMEEYDFALLVEMIVAAKKHLPLNKPFHLFGAGHPLIIPLAVSLGCDMFDSASYMLYAREDRYISSSGTIRLEELEYLGCTCKICSSLKASELKRLGREERILALARHNLFMLKQTIEETKQAIWEGRLWEYVETNSRNHPKAFDAFRRAVALESKNSSFFEIGTPSFKDRGLFVAEPIDIERPEIKRFQQKKLKRLDLSMKRALLILPETKTKPFLRSKIYQEVVNLIASPDENLVTFATPNYGLVPAEISDIFPLSQTMSVLNEYPKKVHDEILNSKNWKKIIVLFAKGNKDEEKWVTSELCSYFGIEKEPRALSSGRFARGKKKKKNSTDLIISKSYRAFKKSACQV